MFYSRSFQLVWTSGGGSGSGNAGQLQRAEVQCRNQAKRQGIVVRSVAPARLQGSYWEAVVEGTIKGRPLQPPCRFYPDGNRAGCCSAVPVVAAAAAERAAQ